MADTIQEQLRASGYARHLTLEAADRIDELEEREKAVRGLCDEANRYEADGDDGAMIARHRLRAILDSKPNSTTQ